jgi:hypothetical protein
MPRQNFKPDTQRFFCKGLNLNGPVDALPDGYFPILKNVRSYQQGRIGPRPGTALVASSLPGDVVTGQTPVHSVRRLQGSSSTWTRVVGAGTHLAVGQLSFTDIDSGYSGDPLTLTPAVPQGSPFPWMYVADRLRMRKVSDDGTVRKVGLPPPTESPVVSLDVPNYDLWNNTESLTGWVPGGTAGSLFLVNYRVQQALTSILFDTGTTGWATIATVLWTNGIRVGCHIQLDPGGTNDETVIVEETHPPVATSTIAGIVYDSGTTGPCVIALTDPGDDYAVNCMVRIGSEFVRVTAVTPGPDGANSFRCSTVSNHVAGETVTGFGSIRAYCKKTHVDPAGAFSGETVRCNAIRSDITTGLGYVDLTQAVNLNRHPDDIIHVSIRCSDISKVTEGKILFDVDSSSNDFAHNYYFLAFHPSDLVPAVVGAKTMAEARTNAVTRFGDSKPLRDTQVVVSPVLQPGGRSGPVKVRGTLDPAVSGREPSQSSITIGRDFPADPRVVPGPPFDTARTVPDSGTGKPVAATTPKIAETSSAWSDFATSREVAPGSDQWLELRFTLRDLVRVGSDSGRSLADVAKVRIQVTVTANITLSFGSLWILRGPGPEVGDVGAPYVYRYRCRHRDTGVRSNFSPVSRGQVSPHRTPVLVTLPYVNDPDVSHLDVERFGGNLLGWRYVGSAENLAGGSVLHDTLDDTVITASASEGNTNYQLWPVIGAAVSGTCDVVGTVALDSAASFNTAWAQGTSIEISGKQYTIDRVVSTSRLELVETASTASAVSWAVPLPIVQGQPLPTFWGPLDGFYFAVGDPVNPGYLYCTNGQNPDSTQENHKIEVTPATEPLQNGCVYNGRGYVWSTERMFQILPDATGLPLLVREIPNGRGLYSRWAFAVGSSIWFLARDGIYETQGGAPVSLTDAALYGLFPHEGQPGQTINGYSPPEMPVRASIAAQALHRMCYYEDWLYFDYKATDTTRATLARQLDTGEWYWDSYTPEVVAHHGEEGQGVRSLLLCGADATTGRLYQSGGSTDNLVPISCQVRTPSRDQGMVRSVKVYGDFMVDAESAVSGVTLALTAAFDNHSRAPVSHVMAVGDRGQESFDLADPANGFEMPQARNISLDITFTPESGYPLLYMWEPRFVVYPESAGLRATDWDDAGYSGVKWVQGIVIEADTKAGFDRGNAWLDTPRTIQVQGDGGVAMAVIVVDHPGRIEKAYSWPGFFSHQMRLVPLDAGLWREFTLRWVWQPAPETATVWETPDQTGGGQGFQHMRDGWVAHISTSDITWRVTCDNVAYSYTIPSSGGRYVKTYVPLRAIKHKARRHKLSSDCPFRLYAEDSEVRVKDWGSPGPYRVERPFGGRSVNDGAPI